MQARLLTSKQVVMPITVNKYIAHTIVSIRDRTSEYVIQYGLLLIKRTCRLAIFTFIDIAVARNGNI